MSENKEPSLKVWAKGGGVCLEVSDGRGGVARVGMTPDFATRFVDALLKSIGETK